MQRHQARLAELAGTNRQRAASEIDVGTPEPERLRDPQTAGGQHAKERGEGRGAQPARRRELPRLLEQRRDLRLREDMVERPTPYAT